MSQLCSEDTIATVIGDGGHIAQCSDGRRELRGINEDWLLGTSFTRDIAFHAETVGYEATVAALADVIQQTLPPPICRERSKRADPRTDNAS